jgi:hypothetical protein
VNAAVRDERLLPPQGNSLASALLHLLRYLKMLLLRNGGQEDKNAARMFGTNQS